MNLYMTDYYSENEEIYYQATEDKPFPSTKMKSTGLNHGKRTSSGYGERDILMGRGGSVNKHSGNKVFRRFIEHKKKLYKSLSKDAKPLLIDSVLQALHNQGARFLKKDEETGTWYEVNRSDAFAKTSQALREGPRKGQKPAKLNCKELATDGVEQATEKTHGGVVTPSDTSGSDAYDPIALTSVDQSDYSHPADFHYLSQPHLQHHAEAHETYARNPSIRSHRTAEQERVVAGYMQDFFYSESSPTSQQQHLLDVHRQFSNTFSMGEMMANEDEMSRLLLSRVESGTGAGLDMSAAHIPSSGLTRQTTDILQLMRDFQNNDSLTTRDAHTSV